MCAICRRYTCPSSCPRYVGRSAELGERLFECTACEKGIYENDDYRILSGKPYCEECGLRKTETNGIGSDTKKSKKDNVNTIVQRMKHTGDDD